MTNILILDHINDFFKSRSLLSLIVGGGCGANQFSIFWHTQSVRALR